MTTEQIYNEARLSVRCSGFIKESECMEYNAYKLCECRKMMCELMKVDMQFTKISYNVLVNRSTFITFTVDTFPKHSDMTPHELNTARVEAQKIAEKRMQDIPYEGFEAYATIKLAYTLNTRDICVNDLMRAIDDKNGMFGFINFDFMKQIQEDCMPTFKW